MPYESNQKHIKKTMPSDHIYDFTKSSERYRWKQDKTREILENLRDELRKSSRRHTVMVDDKCVLHIDTLDMHDLYGAAYRLFGISLE